MTTLVWRGNIVDDNYCEQGMDPEHYENRWKDSLEIECFLKEFCYEVKDIMATAKRDYGMFWQGELIRQQHH